MNQTLTSPDSALHRDRIMKSDIVVAVMALRSEILLTDKKKILDGLVAALKRRSLILEAWDKDVDPELARGIIKHVGSVKGELSIYGVIQDIDIILKRIS